MQFLYLILSLYYGRRNPLFYLIFPMALVSGPGVFIDPRTVLFAPDVFIVGKNMYKDVIIVYLTLITFLLWHKVKIPISKTKPFIFMGVYIVVLIAYTFIKDGTACESINVMRLFTHMILGFFLLLAIFSTAGPRQFIKFFNVLFFATGALSILYVLNSAQIIPIFYNETLYQEVEFGNEVFYRDFATIPYFSHLLFIIAFTSTLMRSNIFNRKALLSVLITYPFVLLFTFTRGLLGVTIIEISIILIFVILKYPKYIIRRSTITVVLGVVLSFMVIQLVFNSQVEYFKSRIVGAKTEGKNETNVAIRVAYHLQAYNILEDENTLIMGGGLSKKHEKEMNKIGAWQADSTIPFWLIFSGFFGVFLFYYIHFGYLFLIFKHLITTKNPIIVALFAIITFTTLSSFFTGGYRWGDPLIFFNYVLVIYILYPKVSIPKINKKLQ